MTTKQLERKASELESLITDHRVVRIQYTEAEHFTVKVNRDMPEWGVKAGEIVHLYQSSYEGYYYILTWDSVWTRHACRCNSYTHRHHCKHSDAVKAICTSKYHQSQPVPARQIEKWDESDTLAHVQDSIESGEFVDPFAGMTKAQSREAYRAMYPDDFYFAA